MSIILNIDTAIDIAYISIAIDGEIVSEAFNKEQKDHSKFLQPAIQALLKSSSLSIQELDAVAISAGPGSYTGLRVGMASAKGLCYALKKPLITINTLQIMAFAAISANEEQALSATTLFCPMIDARRMEVFTALYKTDLEPVMEPCAMVLEQDSFANLLLNNKVFFFGNSAGKWEEICKHENAVFIPVSGNALAMSKLAFKKFRYNEFADLAYSEPFYLKEFFGGPQPSLQR